MDKVLLFCSRHLLSFVSIKSWFAHDISEYFAKICLRAIPYQKLQTPIKCAKIRYLASDRRLTGGCGRDSTNVSAHLLLSWHWTAMLYCCIASIKYQFVTTLWWWCGIVFVYAVAARINALLCHPWNWCSIRQCLCNDSKVNWSKSWQNFLLVDTTLTLLWRKLDPALKVIWHQLLKYYTTILSLCWVKYAA